MPRRRRGVDVVDVALLALDVALRTSRGVVVRSHGRLRRRTPVKLDLYRCDRCQTAAEAVPAIGLPTGWAQSTLQVGSEKAQARHLCPRCTPALLVWLQTAPAQEGQ